MKMDERSKSRTGLFQLGIKPLRFVYRHLIRQLIKYPRKLGYAQTFHLILAPWFGRSEFQIAVPGLAHPLWIRPRTSDVHAFDQIFINESYHLPFAVPARLILDLGANVGYASVYFATHYPEARIVAVEPEASNFRTMVRNTAPYPNVIAIEAAIWPRAEPLAIDKSGPEWGFRVSANGATGMPSVNGVTIDDILARWSEGAPVDLLKIDIEGAEKELFSVPCDSWLGRTRLMVIELHDWMIPGCEPALERATRGYRFLTMVKGEDTILVRNDLSEG